MPNIRWLLRFITVVHRWLYRVSGGRVGFHLPGGMEMLLLTTTGRRSGEPRTTPLLFVRDGERFAVMASNAGDDRDPAWWLNLRARPLARVQIGRESFAARGRRAEGAEGAALFEKLVAAHEPFRNYRKRTSRQIPIVVLERARGGEAPPSN